MNLIYKINLTISESKLIFCINKYQTTFCGNLAAPLKECQGNALKLFVNLLLDDSLLNNLFAADILVVTSNLCLGGRGDYWVREFLVLAHTIWNINSAYLAGACFVGPPGAACKVPSYNHLNRQ